MLKRIYFLIISEFFIANKICERLYRDFFNIVGIVEKKIFHVCVCGGSKWGWEGVDTWGRFHKKNEPTIIIRYREK